jgi:hypothetical protein
MLVIGGLSPDFPFRHSNALLCLYQLSLALLQHLPGHIQLLLCCRNGGKRAARAGIGNRYQLHHLLPVLRGRH